MGRLLRLRRPGRTPYRKFGGSDTNLLSLENNQTTHPDKTSGVEQIYNCSQCGHEGNLKMVRYPLRYFLWIQLYK